MYFDRFDICEAYYLYAANYHGGQATETYAIFGRLNNLQFRPAPGLSEPDDLTENGQEIYYNLVANGYRKENVPNPFTDKHYDYDPNQDGLRIDNIPDTGTQTGRIMVDRVGTWYEVKRDKPIPPAAIGSDAERIYKAWYYWIIG